MLIKKSLLLVTLALFLGGIGQAQTFKYIGAAKCKMCHNKPNKGEQYNKWKSGELSVCSLVLFSFWFVKLGMRKIKRVFEIQWMIGSVGNDHYGEQYISNFKENQVDVTHLQVATTEGAHTGIATIWVETSSGANEILLVKTTNERKRERDREKEKRK